MLYGAALTKEFNRKLLYKAQSFSLGHSLTKMVPDSENQARVRTALMSSHSAFPNINACV